MLNQETTDALGVSLVGVNLAKQISARFDIEVHDAGQWIELPGGGDVPAALCEQILRPASGRRSPEAISARG